jgi:thiamine biosynthesis lipoprotein
LIGEEHQTFESDKAMIHTLEWKAMGCHMLAAVESDERPALLEQTPAWFEEWEQALSRFRPDSELNQLNQSAGKPFRASPVLWSVYQAALEASQRSNGLVTPTLLTALEQAGYDRSFETFSGERQSTPSGIETALPSAQSKIPLWQITIKQLISIPAGVRLDFGGVAKGWAAQQAVQRLKKAGPALVDAGGDIAISGPCAGDLPWHVGVENPFQPGTDLAILQLERGGVATSGRDYHRWQKNGKWMHHIIDPRTGSPAKTDVLTATVIASDVLQAETAAKTALILGSQEGIDWLRTQPFLAGLVVLEDGRYIYTRNFEDYMSVEKGQDTLIAPGKGDPTAIPGSEDAAVIDFT